MQLAQGVDLSGIWDDLSSTSRLYVLAQIAKYHTALAHPGPFSSFGSLRFSDNITRGVCKRLTEEMAYTVGPFKHTVVGTACAGWTLQAAEDVRTIWRQGYEAEYQAMRARWKVTGPQDLDSEPDGDLCIFVDLQGDVQWGEIPPAAETLSILISHFATSVYEQIKVTAILDWDGAAVIPLVLLPQFPQDLCEAAVGGNSMCSGEIYSSLPRFISPEKHFPDATISRKLRIDPGRLAATGDDWIWEVSYTHDGLSLAERCMLRKLYVDCLQGS